MGHDSSELADRVVAVCLGELDDTLPSSKALMHALDLTRRVVVE
jgi:hypothetical protein